MQRLLQVGDEEGRYQSRSEVVQAIATAAVQAGWSEQETFAELLKRDHKGAERVHEIIDRQGLPRARDYVHRSWGKSLARVILNPFASGHDLTLASTLGLRAAADAARWPGLGGASERAVLDALLGIAEKACSIEFTASIRQVAERAGLLEKATGRVLSRLQPEWVVRLSKGYGRHASLWRLNQKEGREDPNKPHTPLTMSGNGVVLSLVGHDAFRSRGLGKNGAVVWSALPLEARGRTASDLSSQLGLHIRTVRRHLARLGEVGLARQDEDHWIRLRRDLDEVARDVGTLGTGDRQQLRNVEDRENYLAFLERRRSILRVRGGIVDGATGEILQGGPEVA